MGCCATTSTLATTTPARATIATSTGVLGTYCITKKNYYCKDY